MTSRDKHDKQRRTVRFSRSRPEKDDVVLVEVNVPVISKSGICWATSKTTTDPNSRCVRFHVGVACIVDRTMLYNAMNTTGQ
jgi:hypothetical protein